MKSSRPKVLHEIAGRSMLAHVLEAACALHPDDLVLVTGPDMPELAHVLEAFAGRGARLGHVVQEDRLGTGHAVLQAEAQLAAYHGPDGHGDVLIVYGDTPLLTAETLARMVAARREEWSPEIFGLAFRPDDPAQYGRVILDRDGMVQCIVEYADAGPGERAVDLCNAGIVLAEGKSLFQLLRQVDCANAKGEYYLTDIYKLAHGAELRATMVEGDPAEVLGVNSRAELAVAEAVYQSRRRGEAMANGATLVDPSTVWFCWDTELGRDVTIEPHVIFGPGVEVEDGATILGFSHITGARVCAGARIGPFARLRPGASIGPGCHVGNFVEIKNAKLAAGAKANHLSYVGDADVGAKANIGAGTITCNYDGYRKHRTVIGAGVKIGSNSALVAPVTLGEGAMTGAGAVIREDVPEDALALNEGRQIIKEGAAKRFREAREKDLPRK